MVFRNLPRIRVPFGFRILSFCVCIIFGCVMVGMNVLQSIEEPWMGKNMDPMDSICGSVLDFGSKGIQFVIPDFDQRNGICSEVIQRKLAIRNTVLKKKSLFSKLLGSDKSLEFESVPYLFRQHFQLPETMCFFSGSGDLYCVRIMEILSVASPTLAKLVVRDLKLVSSQFNLSRSGILEGAVVNCPNGFWFPLNDTVFESIFTNREWNISWIWSVCFGYEDLGDFVGGAVGTPSEHHNEAINELGELSADLPSGLTGMDAFGGLCGELAPPGEVDPINLIENAMTRALEILHGCYSGREPSQGDDTGVDTGSISSGVAESSKVVKNDDGSVSVPVRGEDGVVQGHVTFHPDGRVTTDVPGFEGVTPQITTEDGTTRARFESTSDTPDREGGVLDVSVTKNSEGGVTKYRTDYSPLPRTGSDGVTRGSKTAYDVSVDKDGIPTSLMVTETTWEREGNTKWETTEMTYRNFAEDTGERVTWKKEIEGGGIVVRDSMTVRTWKNGRWSNPMDGDCFQGMDCGKCEEFVEYMNTLTSDRKSRGFVGMMDCCGNIFSDPFVAMPNPDGGDIICTSLLENGNLPSDFCPAMCQLTYQFDEGHDCCTSTSYSNRYGIGYDRLFERVCVVSMSVDGHGCFWVGGGVETSLGGTVLPSRDISNLDVYRREFPILF